MRAFVVLLLAGLAAYGADGDWAKVKALKTGAELQVFKKGSSKPIAAQMDELRDDNLIVIVKKTQTAIPRDQIDRIDARPTSGSRVTKETTTKDTVDPDGSNASSVSTGYSLGGKASFETVYRPTPVAPHK